MTFFPSIAFSSVFNQATLHTSFNVSSSRTAVRNAFRLQIRFFFLNYRRFFFLNYQLLNPGSYLCEGGRDSFHQNRDEQSKTLSM